MSGIPFVLSHLDLNLTLKGGVFPVLNDVCNMVRLFCFLTPDVIEDPLRHFNKVRTTVLACTSLVDVLRVLVNFLVQNMSLLFFFSLICLMPLSAHALYSLLIVN